MKRTANRVNDLLAQQLVGSELGEHLDHPPGKTPGKPGARVHPDARRLSGVMSGSDGQ
jgi:hypothetical protein